MSDKIIRVIRLREVIAMTSVRRSTIYKKLKTDPSFPRPISLSDSKARGAPIGFLFHEVQEWIDNRINIRDS